MRGERKGGHDGDGAPFIGDAVGWEMGHGWCHAAVRCGGAWDHRGGWAVRRGMADSGPAAALMGGALTGAARPVPK
jgi:hypothetical protein